MEKVKIIDTFYEISQCYINGQFNLKSWGEYTGNIATGFREKLEADAAEYDFEREILPILQSLMENTDKFFQAHDSFCEVMDSLEEKVSKKLGTELTVAIVFYLGMCNGAGWATDINGEKAILLGVEKIVELNWCDKRNMIGLIYHELGHIWHFQVRTKQKDFSSQKEWALWKLYSEGMAMYIEQLLCEDENFYHQDTGGWLQWCNEKQKSLYAAFIERVETDDSTQQFFGDWCEFRGKSDVGYYLGCELVKALSSKYSLVELANLDLSDIEQQLKIMCS